MDLVMWGHEHECRIVPERNEQTGVFITQPGSSVATSLCPGEAVQKQVGMLYVKGKGFQVKPIPLTTVRPFVFDTLSLAERGVAVQARSEDLQTLVAAQVELLIERAETQRGPDAPELPLVRLRIDYTGGYETFSSQKFAQRFVGRVANPRDLLLFCKSREFGHAGAGGHRAGQSAADFEGPVPDAHIGDDTSLDSVSLDGLIGRWLEQSGTQLNVLTSEGLSLSVHTYVDKFRRDAMSCISEHQCSQALSFLRDQRATGAQVEGAQLDKHLAAFRRQMESRSEVERRAEVNRTLSQLSGPIDRDSDDGGGNDSDFEVSPAAKRGTARGGRGSRGGAAVSAATGRGGGRQRKPPLAVFAIDSEDDMRGGDANASAAAAILVDSDSEDGGFAQKNRGKKLAAAATSARASRGGNGGGGRGRGRGRGAAASRGRGGNDSGSSALFDWSSIRSGKRT